MKLPKRYQNTFGSIFMYSRFLIIGAILLGMIIGVYVFLVAISR